jgi:hypothetical protein
MFPDAVTDTQKPDVLDDKRRVSQVKIKDPTLHAGTKYKKKRDKTSFPSKE